MPVVKLKIHPSLSIALDEDHFNHSMALPILNTTHRWNSRSEQKLPSSNTSPSIKISSGRCAQTAVEIALNKPQSLHKISIHTRRRDPRRCGSAINRTRNPVDESPTSELSCELFAFRAVEEESRASHSSEQYKKRKTVSIHIRGVNSMRSQTNAAKHPHLHKLVQQLKSGTLSASTDRQ